MLRLFDLPHHKCGCCFAAGQWARAMKEKGKPKETTLILGIGNIALGDEGFGVHVARQMKEVSLPENVRVQEGGVAGFNLLGSFEDVDRIIVVDAMIIDLPPGEIGFFELDDRFNAANKTNLSFHQVGIMELVQISGLLGRTPHVQFLVTKPEKLEMCFELSPDVQKAADKAVRLLTEMLVSNIPVNG